LNLNGVVYDLFWPEWINNKATMLIIGIGVLSFFVFTYFRHKAHQTVIKTNDNFFKLIIGGGVLFILSIFLNNYKIEIGLAFVLILLSVAFILNPAKQALKRHYLPALYYLGALMVMFSGTIVQAFSNIGIIPHYESFGNFWQIFAALTEFALFSVGLGFQINLLKSENEKARSQIEEYLKVINLQQVKTQVISSDVEVSKDTPDNTILTTTPAASEYTPFEYKIKAADVANYDLSPLTDRELEVLSLIASGKANKEIADQLFVSVNTIKSHIQKIYEKLDVNNRIQALAKANSLNIFKKP
jgi:DNA-binding CsgD family transcriptional regulator